MEWAQLLSADRVRKTTQPKSQEKALADLRSEFEKDYHRIIGSASFRRLQDKTQVFPLDKSDFIRTRLTHSLEVSSFAKSLGQNIGENIIAFHQDESFTVKMKEDICSILQCAGLIHDIGNPPFGHFGELAIRSWYKQNLKVLEYKGKKIEEVLPMHLQQDLYHFEGNAQAFRLVTKLHYLVDERGMNLTYGLLGTIMKYPVHSGEVDPMSEDVKDKKMGYYHADEAVFQKVQEATGTLGKRHPLTFILEAADDIAYKTADIEDAFVKGFLTYPVICEELRQLSPNEEFDALEKLQELYRTALERREENPEEYAVKNWIVRVQSYVLKCATSGFTSHYRAIMDGNYKNDLFQETGAEELMELLGDMAHRRVFTSYQIYKMEVIESSILNFLMNRFVKAIIYYDVEGEKPDDIDERFISFISDNYKRSYHYYSEGKNEEEKLYLRLLLVTDYICGMTDSYAKRLYQELTGMF